MHVRNPAIADRPPPYPKANEKAQWAVACAKGEHGIAPPDFILSAGDIVDGEIPDRGDDFTYLKNELLNTLPIPFMPCLGNHENQQGEGIPESYAPYDACFGPGLRNYVFTCRGIGFLVVDTSGAHRTPDHVTAARREFAQRAFKHLGNRPTFVVTHVPLIPMREEEILKTSFGFSSWRVVDPGLLNVVEAHQDTVVAVLSGHLHLTGLRTQNGIPHIVAAGTGGYPGDFTAIEIYDDRMEMRMLRAPDALQDRGGDIHGKPRYPIDYTDGGHPTHELYVSGLPEERVFSLPLNDLKRPRAAEPATPCIHRETEPGLWTQDHC